MQEIIRISEPFDKEEELRLHRLILEIVVISYRRYMIALTIILFTVFISCAIAHGHPTVFSWLTKTGIVSGAMLFYLWYLYNERKINYKRAAKKLLDDLEQRQPMITIECSEQFIRYEDGKTTTEFHWEQFTGYSIYKEHLVLWINKGRGKLLLLGDEDGIHGKDIGKIRAIAQKRLSRMSI